MKKISLISIIVCSLLVFNQLSSAQVPEIDDLSLEASSPDDLTIDSMFCTYDVSESVVETASAWYKNGSPEMHSQYFCDLGEYRLKEITSSLPIEKNLL